MNFVRRPKAPVEWANLSKTLEVVGAVITSDRRVLAFRRSPNKSAAGKWEFPGGKVEPGETPEDALVREIREELGVAIEVGRLISRASTRVGGVTIDLSCFHVSVRGPYPVRSVDHDQLLWMDLGRLEQLDWAEPDLPTVKVLFESSGE